jgi:mRNA interferase MazF
LARFRGKWSLERSIENIRKGDVFSVLFPFSDSVTVKKRPTLVIARSDSNNLLVPGREDEIKLEDRDFRVGKLNLSSCFIRPNIIATIDKNNIFRVIGTLKDEKLNEVIAKIIEILQKAPENPPPSSLALQRRKD